MTIKEKLEDKFGTVYQGGEVTVTGELLTDGKTVVVERDFTISGLMYGNDECFDLDGFYQYVVTPDDKVYACYYDAEGFDDLGDIDYEHAECICDVTGEVEDWDS